MIGEAPDVDFGPAGASVSAGNGPWAGRVGGGFGSGFGPDYAPDPGILIDEPPLTGRSSLPPATAWEFFVRAWRPFGGWTCNLAVFVRGIGVPIAELALGRPVSPFSFSDIALLAGALGFGILRSFDRNKGTA